MKRMETKKCLRLSKAINIVRQKQKETTGQKSMLINWKSPLLLIVAVGSGNTSFSTTALLTLVESIFLLASEGKGAVV